MLQHILANFRQPGSYSLALQWLYSLFVAYSRADIQAMHEAAASAHVNAPQVWLLCCTHVLNFCIPSDGAIINCPGRKAWHVRLPVHNKHSRPIRQEREQMIDVSSSYMAINS